VAGRAAHPGHAVDQGFEGNLDHVENGQLHGWARSLNPEMEKNVAVAIFHNKERLGTVIANQFREDLRRAGIGNGRGLYGFTFPVPAHVRALRKYSLRASVNGIDLGNSPLKVVEDTDHPFRKEGEHVRDFLSEQYLTGTGMELGALHMPAKVAPGARVKYLDSRPTEEVTARYAEELQGHQTVQVDIVTDGNTLAGVADDSQDFFIANQVLEHLENPLLALQNMFRVLKSKGVLFLSLPDKRHTFDIDRPVTTFEHIRTDFEQGADWSREAHYREWIRLVEKLEDAQETTARLEFLMTTIKYPIHFHVWTQFEMFDMFTRGREVLKYPYEIDCFKANGYEALFVLRKL
jgi:SAM-dependent methyltransferase